MRTPHCGAASSRPARRPHAAGHPPLALPPRSLPPPPPHTHTFPNSSAPLPPSQVLFQGGRFQWHRLENLLSLAKEGGAGGAGAAAAGEGQLDLSSTITDGARVSRGGGGRRRRLPPGLEWRGHRGGKVAPK